MRAFAAQGVVAFHVFEFLHAHSGFGIGRFEVGKAGVGLFFVLSGFIMVYTTAADESPARIVPLYWAANALFALTLFLPARHRTRRLIGALIATFLLGRIFGAGTAAPLYGQPILLDFGIGCLIARPCRCAHRAPPAALARPAGRDGQRP